MTLWCFLSASVSSYVKDCFWAADGVPSAAAGLSPPSAGFSPPSAPSAPSAGAPSVRVFTGCYKK